MTGRLSTIITACREFVFRHTVLRYLFYLLLVLALLFYRLYTDGAEIAFVYNEF